MMTTTRQGLFPFVLAAMAFLWGCGQSPSKEFKLSPIICPATGQAQAFAAAQQTVKSMHFIIDEVDREA